MDEEGQITPGFYPNTGGDLPPQLTASPYVGGGGHQYVRLAVAGENFASDPIPKEVYDIYRVQTWKLEATYTDPLPETDPSFDYSGSLSQTFDAGTYHDDFYGSGWPYETSRPEGFEGPVFGTPWTTIEEAINLKGVFESGGVSLMKKGIAGCRSWVEINNGDGTYRDLWAGVIIRPPRLIFDAEGTLIWALPLWGMTGVESIPFPPTEFSGEYGGPGPDLGFALANEFLLRPATTITERGMTRSITALGELAGPLSDPDPPGYAGWSVTLTVESYF
jgi:hypothetical protein